MFLDLKQLHKALLFVCDNGLLCVAAILFLYPIHETKIEFHKGYFSYSILLELKFKDSSYHNFRYCTKLLPCSHELGGVAQLLHYTKVLHED